MIERFDINSVHMTTDEKLQKYVIKKIGSLDKYLPRASRASAHAEVILKEAAAQKGEGSQNSFTCEVNLQLPHETINVSEGTVNMYAAIDIVEQKLKHQIAKYKELHGSGALKRKLSARLSRKPLAPSTEA